MRKDSGLQHDQRQRQLYNNTNCLQRQTNITSNQIDHLSSLSSSHPIPNGNVLSSDNEIKLLHKRQLILNTIEDLKRSLEDQSTELCSLNNNSE